MHDGGKTRQRWGGEEIGADGQASLLIEDDDLEGTAAFLVVLGDASRVRAQQATVIGQDE